MVFIKNSKQTHMNTTHQIITKYIDDAVERAADKAAEKAAEKAVSKFDTRLEEISDKAVSKMDSKIDVAVDTAVKKYSAETKQHMTDLKTFFTLEVDRAIEVLQGRPTEERVREIVQEEIRPLSQKVEIIEKEVKEINLKLA